MRTGIRRRSTTVTVQPSVADRMASEEWKPCAPSTAGWCPPDAIADSTSGTSRKAEKITRGGATTTTGTPSRVSIILTSTVATHFIAMYLPSTMGRRITAGHITGGRYPCLIRGDGMGHRGSLLTDTISVHTRSIQRLLF